MPASSGGRHEAHQGLEAVETCWEAVHPVAEGEIPYPVRAELLDQELVGAENALEQEAAERRTCIAYRITIVIKGEYREIILNMNDSHMR